MIQATQLKRGMCIKHENDLYRVVSAEHKTPGNLRGMVQAKIRHLKSGSISDHRFRSVDMVERAILDESSMEFLYRDGDDLYLMDNTTYEQIPVPASLVENDDLLAPNTDVQVLFVRDAPIRVELPTFVELAVVRTDPGVKGDTVSNVTKPAEVETGATIDVPLFVNEGDRLKIDTRTREYNARA